MNRLITSIVTTFMAAAILVGSSTYAAAQQPTPGKAAPASPRTASRVNLDIKGMYCASCEQTVRAMLMRSAGVKSVTVSAKTGRAVVTYDAARTTPAAIVSTINRLGYTARLSTVKGRSA